MLCDLKQTVVVFDLDDTLYPEADYVNSGVRYVCKQIQTLYGVDLYAEIKGALDHNPKVKWLDLICELAKLPITSKDSFLWMYRLHFPDVTLSASCKSSLQAIRLKSKAVAILTDGRSVTQRLKIKALGLSDLPVYISEDYGASKPAPERFKAIEADYPAQHYVYVADNVRKDFLGCNPLGWIGIGMRGNHRNIHSQALYGLPASALPAHWVNSWEDLTSLLGVV